MPVEIRELLVAATQAGRPLRVDTPLGADALLLTGFHAEESVSRPFRLLLELEAADDDVDATALLDRPVSVTVAHGSAEPRLFHGLVSRFRKAASAQAAAGADTVRHRYRAEVVPWLWKLGLSSDCRVFQDMDVPSIVQQVFTELGFTDFQVRLVHTYAPRDYCVQYRETHLDFVSRLMEEEGIFYFFRHEADRHVLVLGDGPSAVTPAPGAESLRPAPTRGVSDGLTGVFTQFAVERAMHPASVTLTDYNYETPSLSLEATLAADDGGAGEIFDFPGRYAATDEGARYARLRMERAEGDRERADVATRTPGVASGTAVQINGAGGDRRWFVLGVTHHARLASLVGGDAGTFAYENTFTAVPADVPWRPPVRAPRPRVQGTQSALVVGPAGEEIYTDAQGRVKLHFYWDRRSQKDETSSCWVRCSTAWAGRGYGQFSVPRIGQEVLVDFIEGDPDRPVVIGRVYNAEQPPPCNPGGGGVVSGMRTQTHKGDGYNGIEMDDTAGKEKVAIHAQYDMTTDVGHDDTQAVGNDRTVTIGGKLTETVTGDVKLTHDATYTQAVASTSSVSVTGDVSETYSAKQTTDVSGDLVITAGGKISITAGTEIVLTVGGATLTMKAGGAISISGTDIAIDGTTVAGTGKTAASLEVAGNSVKLSPASADVTGKLVNSTATGINAITGATIKLN